MRVPLGAPVYADPRPEPRSGPRPEPRTDPRPEPRDDAWPEMYLAPRTKPHASVLTEPEDQPMDDYDTWRSPSAAPPLWDRADDYDHQNHPYDPGTDTGTDTGTLLLEPGLPGAGTWRPRTRRGRVRRRTATIVVPVIVLVAVAVLALALLTGHGPKFGQLTSSQQPNQAPNQPNQGTTGQSALTIAMYPGQQQRGVFQTVDRIVASGNTIVTMGSQTSDGVVRQQFFVSVNGGATWRLAPVYAASGQKVQ
ncbi:MAG TPA: hypothetical protein VG123_21750, partial [Streptosporangiaceae bacterium]|nr:hypothetical protein [Streptosporangiaceae bacterium]